MKKFIHKLFKLVVLSGIIFLGVKVTNCIKATLKIAKTLPEFLKERTGEKPDIAITLILTSLKVKVAFSQKAIEDEDDLEETILEYIDDFYPELSSLKIAIDIQTKDDEVESVTEEDETQSEEQPTEKDQTEDSEDSE
jgi:hypothetical protein